MSAERLSSIPTKFPVSRCQLSQSEFLRRTSQTLVVRPPHVEVAAGTVGVGGVALTIGPVAVEGFRSATDQIPQFRQNVRVIEAS